MFKAFGVKFILIFFMLMGLNKVLAEYLRPCKGFYSQYCQDEYLLKILNNSRDGFFIDIGAHDGISYSNTYYMEKELGWKGVCFEPHPDRFLDLIKNRQAICENACVSSTEGEVNFYKVNGPPEMLSGIEEFYCKAHRARIEKEIKRDGGTYERIKIKSVNLQNYLENANITNVDLLCIDTEGAEYEILKTIDFKKCSFRIIMVENNYQDCKINKLLRNNGFDLIHRIQSDEIYRNKGRRNEIKNTNSVD